MPYNHVMRHLDILIPFGLPPAEFAADLLRSCKTPALAMLLARAKPARSEHAEAFSRALPHETWLVRQCGLDDFQPTDGNLPVAAALMRKLGVTADDGNWFVVNPTHLHIARDHLVLTDFRQLALSSEDGRALFDTAQSLFEEAGKSIVYGDARTWFARADDWSDLQTSTPDAACGHNIDIWMPKGPGEREWRKLQNEIQMHWHIHPVNQQREASGQKPVNSVWLWGGSTASRLPQSMRYRRAYGLSGWMQALAVPNTTAMADCTPAQVFADASDADLLLLDTLTPAALGNDLSEWLHRLHELESTWFAPVLDALTSKKIDEVSLILSHNTTLSEFAVARRSLQKFWIKPSLSRLLP